LSLGGAKLLVMASRDQRLRVLEGGEHDEGDAHEPELLTVAEAAVYLRVAPKWVYANARELGGYRLLGDRGPWRFRRRDLLERREPPERRAPARHVRARRSADAGRPTRTPLLPAEPRREAS
jgi:hypothetical protein